MEFLISFLVISIVGTLLHFVYEWSNHNKIVSLFAAVNESTWEHIKIALTPMFLWGLYDGYVYGFSPNYFLAKSIKEDTGDEDSQTGKNRRNCQSCKTPWRRRN